MKTRSFLVYALCALLQSCNMVDAQVIWLTNRNMDFTDCDSEERTVRSFNAVSNSAPFDLVFVQAPQQSVIVEGDKEFFDRIHTNVVRGTLEVTMDRGRYRNVRLRVLVTSPDVEMLAMYGSGDLFCNSDIETDGDLIIRMSGSGDLNTQAVTCASLKASVAGSGDLNIPEIKCKGKADISVAGSGDYRSNLIEAGSLSASLAGSGDIRVNQIVVDDELQASVAGSGDIRMNGRAAFVSAKVVGSGDISGDMNYEHISKSKAGSGSISW